MALRANRPGMRLPMRVWDLPIRLFHWVVVALIVVSYVSIQGHWMRVHLLSGYAMLALLLFRLAWGFIGSETARFSAFLQNPLSGLHHLARSGRAEPDTRFGHTEAGGWMVLLMLLLLAAQVGTGLCSNDGGATAGPLARYIGKAASDRVSGVHGALFLALLVLVALHVVAIIAYSAVRRQNLLRPMFSGKKMLPAATRAPRMVPAALAWGILALAAVVVWLFVRTA